jgi:hypothetical protein
MAWHKLLLLLQDIPPLLIVGVIETLPLTGLCTKESCELGVVACKYFICPVLCLELILYAFADLHWSSLDEFILCLVEVVGGFIPGIHFGQCLKPAGCFNLFLKCSC